MQVRVFCPNINIWQILGGLQPPWPLVRLWVWTSPCLHSSFKTTEKKNVLILYTSLRNPHFRQECPHIFYLRHAGWVHVLFLLMNTTTDLVIAIDWHSVYKYVVAIYWCRAGYINLLQHAFIQAMPFWNGCGLDIMRNAGDITSSWNKWSLNQN